MIASAPASITCRSRGRDLPGRRPRPSPARGPSRPPAASVDIEVRHGASRCDPAPARACLARCAGPRKGGAARSEQSSARWGLCRLHAGAKAIRCSVRACGGTAEGRGRDRVRATGRAWACWRRRSARTCAGTRRCRRAGLSSSTISGSSRCSSCCRRPGARLRRRLSVLLGDLDQLPGQDDRRRRPVHRPRQLLRAVRRPEVPAGHPQHASSTRWSRSRSSSCSGSAMALVLCPGPAVQLPVRTILFVPWAVPTIVAALSFRWIYDDFSGLLNNC